MRRCLFILLLICYYNASAQQIAYIDSLFRITTSNQNDSVKAAAQYKIGKELEIIGSYDGAMNHHKIALKLRKKNGALSDVAASLNSLGVVSRSQGNYVQAMDYYFKSLKISEQINNKGKQAMVTNNIGVVYRYQKDYKKAYEYYLKALKIDKEVGDFKGQAYDYGNIAIIFNDQGENDSALFYNKLSESLLMKIGDEEALIQTYNVIATLYYVEKKMDSSRYYYNLGLKIANKLNLKEEQVMSTILVANTYWKTGNPDKALIMCEEALKNAEQLGNKKIIQNSCDCISYAAEVKGDIQKAYDYYIRVVELDKEIYNKENDKMISRIDMQHEFSKKEDEILAEKKRIEDIAIEKQKRQKSIIISIALGLVLLLVFFFVLLKRYKVIRHQKVLIEIKEKEAQTQRLLVEEKNKEITDSITYAKRIQSAILPSLKIVKEHLKESFILYKPKDIVAGDFYWLEVISSLEGGLKVCDNHPSNSPQGENFILFAAADCTGHGVPGAMVSVVCNNALNRSVREHGLIDPGEILNKTREIVIQEFEKSEEEVKDGMDIALCSLEGNTLQYAGANNPLWVVRKKTNNDTQKLLTNNVHTFQLETSDFELLETKANKQPIGKIDNPLPFSTHTIELQKGDTIYIFSDGFVDQFGGEKEKKFKAKAFRELLLSIQDKTMEEQKIIINNTFETWKGNLDQVDDVCVIGVRI